MANTTNGIYYPDNYNDVADVPNDMKKLSESVDIAIENIKTEETKQCNKIIELQNKNTELEQQVVELSEENTTLKNQIPTGEAEGNPIHISDSSDMECEIAVIGNAEQNGEPTPEVPVEITTVGNNVNLFDKDNANIVGLYIAKAGDTTLTQGTKAKSFYLECKPNTTYTIQKIKGNALAVGYTKETPTTSSVLYGAIRNDSTSITITTGENAKYLIVYYNNGSESVTDQQLLDSIKVEKGVVATPYSSHGLGNIRTTISSKNIIPFGYKVGYKKIIYGVDIEVLDNHRLKLNGTSTGQVSFDYLGGNCIYYKKGLDYTLSCNVVSGTSSFKKGILAHTSYRNDNVNQWGFQQTYPDNITGNETKFVEEDGYSERFMIYSDSNVTFNNFIIEVQVEVGKKATEYEDHKGHEFMLPIQKEMLKIGDYEDCFIRRGDNWYEQHIIKKKIFDGTENFTIHTAGTNENYLTVYAYISGMKHVPKNNLLSNYFKAINSIGSKNCIYGGYEVEIDISINKTVASNVDEFKAKLAEWKANSTPMELYYPLATPELIPCTEEQEEILNSFYTYRNTTNITASGIANLKVNYKKDLGTVINNLSQAIVGGN